MAAPSDIFLSNVYVNEAAANSTVVATLGVVDPDGLVPTFSLLNNAGGRFEVFNNAGVWQLRVANSALLDYEAAVSHAVTVQVDDGTPGGLRSETFTIALRETVVTASTQSADFVVNTTLTGDQVLPTISALANNNFVVAWQDSSATAPDTAGTQIRGRVMNADGTPFAANVSDFIINTTTALSQFAPVVATLSDGRFVITWFEGAVPVPPALGDYQIRGRVLNADGTPSANASDFVINTTTAGSQQNATVAALADGRFVVAWADTSGTAPDTSGSQIRARVMNGDGTPFSATDFIINTTTNAGQTAPTVATLSDGRFVVTWQDASLTAPDASGNQVRGRVMNADGTPSSAADFIINTTTATSQFSPSVAALADNRFVVTWYDGLNPPDTTLYEVRGRVMNADGTPVTATDFVINTTTLQDQRNPSVTALPDGRFMVSWFDLSQTGSDTSANQIRGRVMNADGTPSTVNDFTINTTTLNSQFYPTLDALPDGRVVVTWIDESQSTVSVSDRQIRAVVLNIDAPNAPGYAITGGTVGEHAANGTVVATLSGVGLTYELVDNAGGRFAIVGNTITVANGTALDFATAAQHSIALRVTNASGVQRVETLPVFVEDRELGATITGSALGTVSEDGTLTASGDLNVADSDPGQALFAAPGALAGTYGDFTFSAASGSWEYVLRNAIAIVQALNSGQAVHDTLMVTSLDGSATATIDVTINGANEAAPPVDPPQDQSGWICGDDGNNRLQGTALADDMDGRGGHDRVWAGDGDDTIHAAIGDGNDRYNGGGGEDTADYSAIEADVRIDLGGYARSDETGRDWLRSMENAIGGSGDDDIRGNRHANELTGGAGDDRLRGGGGEDIFIFASDFGDDRIRDFDSNPSGGQDLLDISALGITADNFEARVEISDIGRDTLITIDGNTITLLGVRDAASVTALDFLLAP